jgi:MFS family permease
MTRVVRRFEVDAAQLDQLFAPRTQPVLERQVAEGRFEAVEGPVTDYHRTVVVVGESRVTQTVEFRLAIPYFGWFFVLPIGVALRRPPWKADAWWLPPQRLDARASSTLATLAALGVVFGYLSTLFNQTIAFAADEFHASNSAQGVAGGAVRFGGLLALFLASAADRRGRRTILLGATTAGCLFAATGAVAPSLGWLAGSQVLARGCATAVLIVLGIMTVEEMPAGSRAYAIALLGMAIGLGAGFCVASLVLADIGTWGWRLVYLLPLVGLLLVRNVARRLPETRRFERPHAQVAMSGHGRRLWLLAAAAFLLNVFIAPNAQFTNRFLKHERHYSGGSIGLFQLATGTPGVIGLIVAGRAADLRGRRLIGGVALAGSAVFNVAYFFTSGWAMWGWGALGSIAADATAPILGVYGPELFPTSLRGRTNGVITVIGLGGSALGLVAAGAMSDAFGRIGPSQAVLATGPLLLALLVLAAFPETARRELEDLNPEDRPP